MTTTPRVTTRKSKGAGAVMSGMIMSCWSGDFSVSSSSSSQTCSPVSGREIEATEEAEGQVADDCDVL